MTLLQFKFLDESGQKLIIQEQGKYLSERIDGDYTYKLYQLNNFYIEEQWHTKFNVVRNVTSFINQDQLKNYSYVI